MIDGSNGSATGFLVNIGSKQFLYTAVHVLSGLDKPVFKTPDSSVLSITSQSTVEISNDPNIPDVARILIDDDKKLPTEFKLAPPPALGTPIESPGNSSGQGVIAATEGKIAGIGPSEIEISNEVVPGNSGGPVLVAGTGDVIGVVTRASREAKNDIWVKNTRFSEVRRFAAIPIKIENWSQMPLEGPRNQSKRLENFRQDTRLLDAVNFLTFAGDGVEPPEESGEFYTTREVLADGATRPVGQTIISAIAEVNRHLKKGTGSFKAESSMKLAYTRFFTSVRQVCNTGVAAIRPDDFVRYLRPTVTEELNIRKSVVADIVALEPQIERFDFVRKIKLK